MVHPMKTMSTVANYRANRTPALFNEAKRSDEMDSGGNRNCGCPQSARIFASIVE
jgi:hypothetical protein